MVGTGNVTFSSIAVAKRRGSEEDSRRDGADENIYEIASPEVCADEELGPRTRSGPDLNN